ncbi:transcriptional regulator [Stenotrophomonas phage vB_SmaS_DLP_5]|uniref:Transcriptional regulator n=1 Tax=Stenotrophomonas phage vB_SmaS_DLP_5 TaxID=2044561 RepID=A0A2D2W2J2_9CAUD|nr:transcriptional regulator [Stenotrophomonas phage vB_SmaS_DLP_5]ATS92353.1 transcriptional regulator [Stenotrophomonas phage vB_SmaS_DLP_5]
MKPFDRWYAKNRESLLKQRREKYRTDPQFRQAALSRSARQRANRQKPSDDKPFGFGEVAELLGVSTVTLRTWKRKDYYPEPSRHGKAVVFSAEQVNLLKTLRSVFVKHGWNMRDDAAKEELESTIRLIYANWS